MQAQVYNLAGEVVDTLELNDYIFGIEPNIAVLHQAVVRQQANARLGTHSTLRRGEVRGGGKKPYRQKGTGNARQGSRRSPQFRGGGVVFGPHPRSYEQDMPRKMRRLAMRSALSAKARDGQIIIIDSLDELEPRTRAMIELLAALDLGGQRTLVMLPERMENVYHAANNLGDCKLTFAQYLSIVDMLKYHRIMMTVGSLDAISFLNDSDEPIYTRTGAPVKDESAEEAPIIAAVPAAEDAETAVAEANASEADETAADETNAEADETDETAADETETSPNAVGEAESEA